MAGYIGATTVSFSVTEADIKGDIKSTDASPEVTLQNTTEEDTDGGRESKITFKGEQSGGEITTLAQIQASHDGTADDEKGDLIFSTNDGADGNTPTERLRIDADGNVGIGTSSPSNPFEVIGAVDTNIATFSTLGDGGGASNRGLSIAADTYGGSIRTVGSSASMGFDVNGSEAARIDASGNLLVGTTTATPATTTGVALGSSGYVYSTRASAPSGLFNRTGTDGDIAQFRKDGSTVGSIGTYSSDLVLATAGDCGIRLNYTGATGADFVAPCRNTGALRDNAIDLGSAAGRWDDIYATNGTIQTSDQNEKQQIASLTDAEITAAKAISKLFKTFKWNDSVAEKGDAARTHSGVIAQDVEQAMTDAGLNAGDYAFFISTTWWETQTEVPAVEADEENGVEGKEAYTRTDTYETAEEAPEGATERNRKGIRYPQLLSFIGAATEQRLASIESRLDALESA